MACKPIGGSSQFMEEIGNNPDWYGPFWLVMTWSLVLLLTIAFKEIYLEWGSRVQMEFSEILFLIKFLLLSTMGVPLILMIILYCKSEEIDIGKTLCIYGYS